MRMHRLFGTAPGLTLLVALVLSGCAATVAGGPVPGTAGSGPTTTLPSTSGPNTTVSTSSGPISTDRPPTPPHVPPAEVVQGQELIGLETQTGGPVGWRGSNRFVDTADWKRYLDSLDADGRETHPIAEKVAVVPEGRVLVAATVAVGCDKPDGATLLNDGSSYFLVATGLPEEPTPECYAPLVTVAVVSVPSAAVPSGRVGVARQVVFERVAAGGPYRPGAVELTGGSEKLANILPDGVEAPELAELADGVRRFAFLLTGCRGDAAALEIDEKGVSAHLDNAEYSPVECVVAQPFLAVFDVADAVVPPGAKLVG